MDTLKKNKAFIIRYFNTISGVAKTQELIDHYVTDPKLQGHIQFFESAFPKYEMLIDEITAEGNRVVVRMRAKGKHEGVLMGIPATHREINMPGVVGYEIENEKIVSHWLISDTAVLMEQLGLASQPV